MSGRREIVSRGSSGDPVAVRRIVIAADRERLALSVCIHFLCDLPSIFHALHDVLLLPSRNLTVSSFSIPLRAASKSCYDYSPSTILSIVSSDYLLSASPPAPPPIPPPKNAKPPHSTSPTSSPSDSPTGILDQHGHPSSVPKRSWNDSSISPRKSLVMDSEWNHGR